jgi:hypothetical protein
MPPAIRTATRDRRLLPARAIGVVKRGRLVWPGLGRLAGLARAGWPDGGWLGWPGRLGQLGWLQCGRNAGPLATRLVERQFAEV